MAVYGKLSRRGGAVAALCVAAVLGASMVTPALADEVPAVPVAAPTTVEEAREGWLAAARGAEELNQAVLAAQEEVTALQSQAEAAQAAADATLTGVAAAEAQVAQAEAQVAVYKPKLDAFANASLRGARLTSMTSLLVAESPDDYLDQAAALDHVAADTLATMAVAKEAEVAADAAKAEARGVRAAAQQTADLAAAAVADARQAVTALEAQQAELHASIATFEQAFSRLSTADRAAFAAADAVDVDVTEYAVRQAPDAQAGIAVAAALGRRGLPYVWGAVGPNTFDCSGLMLWAWQQAGITIPRTSAAQSTLPSVPLDELQPGDLVTYYSPVTHVGMYIGDGLVVHASMPGVPIKVVPLDKGGPNPTGHRVPR